MAWALNGTPRVPEDESRMHAVMTFARGILPALKRHSYACLPEALPDNF